MNIKSTVKNIFLKIAKSLGLELTDKTDIQVDYTATGLNPTAIGAGVVANIAIDDSDIIIEGNSARAEALRSIKDYFVDEIETVAAEVSLGTGDCIIRPFTDGKRIGINIIGNDNFVITESIGNHLKGIIIKLDEIKKDNDVFRLFESQTLDESQDATILHIKRFAYKNEDEISLEATSWKNIEPEEVITADQLLVGRYKCPTINRENYNSVNGVPITYGCEKIIENIKTKYRQYNEEFDRKEAKVFADRTIFKADKDEKGGAKLTLNNDLFVRVRGNVDGGISNMIQDYSPAIRESEFQSGNNFNLSVLELCCGFSRGIFTTPETAFATATEMKNSLKKTFAFVKKFRRRIENGNEMLFKALDIIMNVAGIAPTGSWDIRHDWSYDYIEQTTEKFNQLLQAHSAGAIKTEDLTAWVMGLDSEAAKKYVAELKAEAVDETEDDLEDDAIKFE